MCLATQSCLTLCDPVDHSPPGSSVHGFSREEYCSGLPALLQGIFPTQGLNPGFPYCKRVLYHLSYSKWNANLKGHILWVLAKVLVWPEHIQDVERDHWPLNLCDVYPAPPPVLRWTCPVELETAWRAGCALFVQSLLLFSKFLLGSMCVVGHVTSSWLSMSKL